MDEHLFTPGLFFSSKAYLFSMFYEPGILWTLGEVELLHFIYRILDYMDPWIPHGSLPRGSLGFPSGPSHGIPGLPGLPNPAL